MARNLRASGLPVWETSILNRRSKSLSGTLMWQAAGFSGKGVRVAMLDNKLNPELEFLWPPVKQPLNYETWGEYPHDALDSHGQRTCQVLRECAPSAEILCLPYWNYGRGNTIDSIERSIRWCAENNIQILNASISGSSRSVAQQASQYAYDSGVLLITSAGNSGSSGFDINDPEGTRTTTDFANDPIWIAVANCHFDDYPDETGVIRRAGSSSVGPSVYTSCIGGHVFPRALQGGENLSASGTSYSAPALSGALALYYERYMQLHGQWPSVSHVRAMVRGRSQQLAEWGEDPWLYDDNGRPRSYGYGYGFFSLPNFGVV